MKKEPRIFARDLSFSYGQALVLDKLNFTINENQIVTLIGPNGGGKTTLLRLIIGLLQANSGSLEVRGEIGYVPQYPGFDRQFPMTIFDVVLSGLIRPFGFYTGQDRRHAEESLEKVGLSSIMHESISAISGGQTQRMLIARALVSKKDILLLDEPTASIDQLAVSKLYDLIKELAENHTILLVTHDSGFVSDITDRVFCLNKKLVEHPVDDAACGVAAFGQRSRLVRHDVKINPAQKE